MSLTAGIRLGPYEIQSAIGAGGMGEVYKARDTRLDRTVAIKVLPAEVSADPDRRARFEREAKTIAQLNHPHICVLHDVGEHPSTGSAGSPQAGSGQATLYLVMEYLTGETLAERLARGPIPREEALRVATEIADALTAAHRQAVIHRDLKPGNVMLTKTGTKLLDFGLAKLKGHGEQPAGAPLASAPTERAPLTAEGVIVGTLPYMAPEQVEGKPADARTDVWAFGTILYEMLTGTRAFGGGSAASLIGNIMHGEPPALTSVLPLTPPAVDRLVRKCLAKDPEARWQAASDVADELRWLTSGSGLASSAGTPVTPRVRRRLAWILGAGVLMVALAAAGLWVWRAARARDLPPERVEPLTSSTGTEQHPALSPDGSQVAFSWNGEKEDNEDIYVQVVEETYHRPLTNDPLADIHPCWSPDGRQIAFMRVSGDNQSAGIFRISANGGPEQKLAELTNLSDPYWGGGLSWSPDGKRLAVARDRPAGTTGDQAGIYLLAVESGELRRVTTPRAPAIHVSPSFSWDGRSLAFIEADLNTLVCDAFIQLLSSEGQPLGTPRQITHTGWLLHALAWHPDGSSLIVSAVPDLEDARLYRVAIDGHSAPERIEVAGFKADFPTTSHTGNRLVFGRAQWDGDIYRLHTDRGAWEPLVKSSRWEHTPEYSPDGRKVSFTSNETGTGTEIWVANADGSNKSRLTYGPGRNQGTARWSPVDPLIAFDSQDDAGQYDIYVRNVTGGQNRRITFEKSNQNHPSFSHDGQWIYFTSNETGRSEVWRAPAAGGASKQLTTAGGALPLEAGDRKTLVYLKDTGELFAKPLAGGPERRLASDARPVLPFAVAENRVYYWDNTAFSGAGGRLRFYDLLSRTSGEVARVTLPQILGGLSVSPDRQTILFVANEAHPGMDLWRIEHFR